jgi:hypothetical protein
MPEQPNSHPIQPTEPRETSDKAALALLLALASVWMLVLAALPAILMALSSLAEIRHRGGRLRGKWLATTALVLGCLGVLWSAYVAYVWYDFLRQAGGRSQVENSMKEMSRAVINAADNNAGLMPPHAICDKDGKPLLSWRVAILPYIEQEPLYRQFNQDEPWDGPNNSRLIPLMPKIYAHQFDRDGAARGLTYYRVFTGPRTPFPDLKPPFPPGVSPLRYPEDFRDGTSNTILIVEAADAVPWTKPDDLPYDPDKPLPKLGGHLKKYFVVAMADGTGRPVRQDVSESTLRAVIDPDDGQPCGSFDW